MDWDVDLDAEGLLCPLPVLRARKRLSVMTPGAVMRLRATDPASWVDVPHFCAQSGHQLLLAREEDGVRIYLIRRGE
jgi:tRNA 2-thiouridine synthesizing protein A